MKLSSAITNMKAINISYQSLPRGYREQTYTSAFIPQRSEDQGEARILTTSADGRCIRLEPIDVEAVLPTTRPSARNPYAPHFFFAIACA